MHGRQTMQRLNAVAAVQPVASPRQHADIRISKAGGALRLSAITLAGSNFIEKHVPLGTPRAGTWHIIHSDEQAEQILASLRNSGLKVA